MEPIMAGDARPPIEFRFPTPFLFGALSIDCVVIGGSPWGRDPPPYPALGLLLNLVGPDDLEKALRG